MLVLTPTVMDFLAPRVSLSAALAELARREQYLALVQRAAFDCFGGDWTVAVCRFFLAGAGTRLVDAHGQPHSSAGRNSATDMGRHAGYADGDWRLRADRVPALPADYRDFSADQ